MKIFIDTNIFLDLILKRKGFEAANIILNGCVKNIFKGYVADITLLNIDYIASKQVKEISKFLQLINQYITVVGANNIIFNEALNIKNNDLEDSLQYTLAYNNKCDLIITNDKKFYQGEIKLINSLEFIEKYT